MFGKVPVANRGEIALRIARAGRGLSIATAAVYTAERRDAGLAEACEENGIVFTGPSAHEVSRVRGADLIEINVEDPERSFAPGPSRPP